MHIYLTLMKRNSMKSKHTKVIEALEGLVQDLHLMENRMRHYSIAKEDYLILDDMKKSIENKKKVSDICSSCKTSIEEKKENNVG